jgi:hypothetical protein
MSDVTIRKAIFCAIHAQKLYVGKCYWTEITQCPGAQLDYPVPGGNKYRNLDLQVGGVLKIETIKYAHESRRTHIWERLRWRCQAKIKLQTRLLVREGAPHQQTRNCLKINKERRKKIGRGSQMGAWHQDRLAYWPSVEIYNFDFDLNRIIRSAVSHWLESLRTHNHIFTVSFETPPIWRVRYSYLYPPEQGDPVIPRALRSLFVASYYSQGYGISILTRLYTGILSSERVLHSDKKATFPQKPSDGK